MIAAVAGWAWLVAGAAEAKRIRLDGVAAFVNDDVITISEVVRLSRELQAGLAKAAPDTAALNAAYAEALETAIGRRLVLKAYAGQKKIAVPDAMVQERVDTIINTSFHGDRAALIEALTQDGIGFDAWRDQIRDNIIVGAMRNVEIDSKIRVSPVAVREHYDAHREDYVQVGKVRLRMLVLPSGEREKADRLAAELRDGADFATLAREHSTGPRAADGGDRGWMALDMLREELAATARTLPTGKTSDPVLVGSDLYILRVDERAEGHAQTFDDVQSAISGELRMRAAARMYQAWIAALRRDAFVRIVEDEPF